MEGFGGRAGKRVPGQSARVYASYSIIDANRFLVPGYSSMTDTWRKTLTPQEVADLVAYILTL